MTLPKPHHIHATALSLAKDAIKNSIQRNGGKLSLYMSRDVEIAAKKLIASDPEFDNLASLINNFFARKSGVKFP